MGEVTVSGLIRTHRSHWVGANGGPGVHVFEVTRAKRVVYRFDDHLLVKSATTAIALDD